MWVGVGVVDGCRCYRWVQVLLMGVGVGGVGKHVLIRCKAPKSVSAS